MKKLILIISIIFVIQFQSFSCDVCGCSLGGNYFGILPQFGKNFVGMRWSQASFHASMNHNSNYLSPEYSDDTFNKLEIWGRFYINKKIQVFAFIPYSFNQMEGTHQSVRSNGLSDITLSSNYLIINNGEDASKKIKHSLSVGLGLKLPTGKYNFEDQGELVNPNFQMGTGSTDISFSSIYTVRYNKVGSNLETGYKVNSANKNDYRFGNQFYVANHFFYWQQVKSIAVLPNAGLYFENGQKHKDGKVIQNNTGGHSLLLSTGIEAYVKSFTIGFNFKLPLVQNYNTDDISEISAAHRITASFSFNF